jgi:hypothetical protein
MFHLEVEKSSSRECVCVCVCFSTSQVEEIYDGDTIDEGKPKPRTMGTIVHSFISLQHASPHHLYAYDWPVFASSPYLYYA